MKFRRSAPITLILLALALWVLWLNRGRWQPLLFAQFDAIASNAPLLEGLSALIDIGGFLLNTAVTILGILLLYRRPDQDEASEPIRATTVEELRRRLGRGGQVNWIDRQISHPDILVSHRRLVITGRMKLGKTREAIELIRRAIAHDLIPSDRVYVPGPTLPFLNPDTVRDLLRRAVDPQAPLLLFIDDLPYHYHGDALDQLVAALTALSHTKATYIVATARDDHLTSDHDAWFRQHGFHILSLSPLDRAQTARLVDSATGTFNLQVDEDARDAFVAAGDGTPELILINFRRLDADGVTQVDEATAQQTGRHSLSEAWAAARANILERRPEADHIFSALAAFHTAGVTPYTPLVLAFAAHLWRRQPRPTPPWHRYRLLPLRYALVYLAHFDIVVQQDQINYSDFVAEEQMERHAAALELAPFMLRYRRLFHRPFLRRLYPHAELHMWALYDLATAAQLNGEYERSLRLCNTALRVNTHFGLYIQRGFAYFDLGNLDAAIADCTRAITLNPEFSPSYCFRGAAYLLQGILKTATSDYTSAIGISPEFAGAYFSRGNTHEVQESFDAAIFDYTRAIELEPKDARNYRSRARAYEGQGNLNAAISNYSRAIELDPENARNYSGRGKAHRGQGNFDAAISDYTQAIELDPEDVSNYCDRGRAYEGHGDLDDAISDYTQAIAIDPEDSTAYFFRGCVYKDRGKLDAAISDCNLAITVNSEFVHAFLLRGISFVYQGKLDNTISDYTKAITINPEYAVTYLLRGLAYRNQGELTAAIADYDEALNLNPNDADACNNRGVAYRQLGQLDRAMADFNQALELAPDDDWYLYNRGLTWLMQDQSESAAADLNRAIEVAQQGYDENPQDWRNTFNLALYHLAAGNATAAEQLYNEALTTPAIYLREAIQDLDDFLHHFPEHDQVLRLRALLQDQLDA